MREHRRCSNCRFVTVRKIEEYPEWYECIKNAPTANPEDGSAWWPSVKPDDQCGEWNVGEDRLEGNVEAEYYRAKQLEGKGGDDGEV